MKPPPFQRAVLIKEDERGEQARAGRVRVGREGALGHGCLMKGPNNGRRGYCIAGGQIADTLDFTSP